MNELDVLDAVRERAVGEPAGPRRRRRPVAVGVRGAVLLAAGLLAFLAGAGGWLGGVPSPVAWLLALAGAVVAYRGLGDLLRFAAGPRVDVLFWVLCGWLVLVVGSAALAPLLPLPDPSDTAASLIEPSMARPDLFSSHPLGTNNFGLDLLSRVVYGARASLTISVIAVAVGLVVGGTIGVVAGYRRGLTDRVIGTLVNALLAFPPLVLLLALATNLEPSVSTLLLGLSILAVPLNVRLARAVSMQVAEREFVEAARSMGATHTRVFLRELLPNVLPSLISYSMIVVAALIVAEASLSFLGLGIRQPEPSWGNMIAEGQQGVFEQHPHVVLVPGAALFLTVFAFNLIGERLQSRWDPRRSRL
ncbi:ABC transporter permease [Phytohabitans sp. ZYX-F-186]|uniref:ABC transporter permease n=1 Tax=Phytohabitans maris TaxID=3071409 RepID=A0ABU0Z9P5_9ACTN|nr:ABC transporter permease [Phytohabitans sp. ZYX-F-186]MDQ7903713.1 ABC transporter permease [Phytohabitans sp. ZYX-F-186]